MKRVPALMNFNSAIANLKSLFGKVTPWIIFVSLAVAMLFDPGRDTLQISSAALATTLALASVTFSYARTLKDGSLIRDELVFAGENLVRGAAVFLIAAIFKHGSHDLPRYMSKFHEIFTPGQNPVAEKFFLGHDSYEIMVAVVAFIFFLIGLVYAQFGIRILLNIIAIRLTRRPGSQEYFVSIKSVKERLAELRRIDEENGI